VRATGESSFSRSSEPTNTDAGFVRLAPRGRQDSVGGANPFFAMIDYEKLSVFDLGRAGLLIGLACTAIGCAGLETGSVLGQIFSPPAGSSGALSTSTIANGLKEALRIGTERTVADTSRPGGFLDNPFIRIAIPEQLTSMAQALRGIGMSAQVDGLEVAMNEAAERASAEAKPVFWNAITSMTLTDAQAILNGGDTAATEYFREATSAQLQTRFAPIISEKINEVGLARTYDSLVTSYNRLPFVTAPAVDLDAYVTDQALDGLFGVLAQEEQRIRTDPVARSTELLQRVFGSPTD
jgi:hypothetical protein